MSFPVLYFAYGSNMSLGRLRQRVPSARLFGVGRLSGYRLVFHKAGRDGSAKCDAVCSRHPDDILYGVVFHIDPAQQPELDRHEGLGSGYERRTVAVTLDDDTRTDAFTYYATRVDAGLLPFSWYREHVMRGAHEHRLPASHIAAIAAVDVVEDSDRARHHRELAIYE